MVLFVSALKVPIWSLYEIFPQTIFFCVSEDLMFEEKYHTKFDELKNSMFIENKNLLCIKGHDIPPYSPPSSTY